MSTVIPAHRVLVCGSRTFDIIEPIGTVLDGLDLRFMGNLVVIHGCAKGADSLADRWAKASDTVLVEQYPADWNRYGRQAGYMRNKQMLEEGKPDEVWAFIDKPLKESKGTKMMVELASAALLPVRVVRV